MIFPTHKQTLGRKWAKNHEGKHQNRHNGDPKQWPMWWIVDWGQRRVFPQSSEHCANHIRGPDRLGGCSSRVALPSLRGFLLFWPAKSRSGMNYAFFQVQIDPETKHIVSEDFFFTDAVRKIGHESFVPASERTYHTGEFDYVMNLPLIAQHPMAQRETIVCRRPRLNAKLNSLGAARNKAGHRGSQLGQDSTNNESP